jgi:MFS family permease
LSRPPTSDIPPAGPPARPGPPGAPSLPRYTLPLAFSLQAVISAGDGLILIALASRVYQGLHASWAVAAVFLAVTIPITALAPLAGLLLDRLPPRPVLVAAAAGQAVVALALTQVAGIGPVLALAAGFGVCAAVLQPGLGAIVPRLVSPAGGAGQPGQAGRAAEARRAAVTRANGYLQAATWGGFTAGPLLAAALIAAGGAGLALVGVAVVYAVGTVGLCALPLAPPDPPASQADDGRGGLVSQLSAGLRFLRQDVDAGLLVLVVGAMVVFANMAVVAEVAFAESVLGAGPTGYSVLVAAWTAGMLAGTLAGGRLPERRLALATLAGTIATGAGLALAGTAAVLWQAAAAYAFGGLANGLEVVATRSFLNHRAPPQVAGRVFAVYSGVLFGAASLGMAAAGGLLGSLNPRLVLFLAGGGGLVAAGVGALFYARHHVRAARSQQARPRPEPGAPPVAAPPEEAPHRTAPPEEAPHRTTPHEEAPHRTTAATASFMPGAARRASRPARSRRR